MATTEAPGTSPGHLLKGGAWLLESTDAASVFTPEHLTEEHKLIAQTTEQFVMQEAVPALPQLEKHDWTVARELLKRCGELGLLGVDVPEEYGGLALDKVTSLLVSERIVVSPRSSEPMTKASTPPAASARCA